MRAGHVGPRRAARPGTPSSRATASRCATTARRRSTAVGAGCHRDRAASSAWPGTVELRYRPRSKAADAEALAAELAERARRRPRARLHHATARTATTSRCVRDGRDLRIYGSQGEQRLGLLALLLAEREVLEPSAAHRR